MKLIITIFGIFISVAIGVALPSTWFAVFVTGLGILLTLSIADNFKE